MISTTTGLNPVENKNRYKNMLKTIDSILFGLWKVIEALIIFAAHLVLFLIPLFRIFPGFLFKLPYLRGIERSFSKILKSQKFGSFCDGSKHYSKKFSEKMFESARFRRISFIIFGILLFLYLYPPSHWPPWYKYQEGTASHYSTGFWFNRTANGEIFIPIFNTAAHNTLPLGITVKVVNPENGKTVYVRINDRGPYVKGRILDLSSWAAKRIGLYEKGTGKVIIYTHKKYKK